MNLEWMYEQARGNLGMSRADFDAMMDEIALEHRSRVFDTDEMRAFFAQVLGMTAPNVRPAIVDIWRRFGLVVPGLDVEGLRGA